MQLHHSILRPALIAAAGAALLAPIARADQKVDATTTIDGPQLRAMIAQMSPEQRAAMSKYGMGGAIATTTFVSGKKVRTDTSAMSILVDPITQTMTTLNRTNQTYSTRPYNAASQAAAGTTATITDLHNSKTILGHVAHHYKITITTTSGPMAGSPINGELWAATDIPQPPMTPMGGPAGELQSQFKKIKGFPLLTVIEMPNSPTGPITIKVAVKSISNAPLPASTFTIPAGYKKAAPGTGAGMPGMPGAM